MPFVAAIVALLSVVGGVVVAAFADLQLVVNVAAPFEVSNSLVVGNFGIGLGADVIFTVS